jgi:hypothetical protein
MLGKYGIQYYLQCVYKLDGIIKRFFPKLSLLHKSEYFKVHDDDRLPCPQTCSLKYSIALPGTCYRTSFVTLTLHTCSSQGISVVSHLDPHHHWMMKVSLLALHSQDVWREPQEMSC